MRPIVKNFFPMKHHISGHLSCQTGPTCHLLQLKIKCGLSRTIQRRRVAKCAAGPSRAEPSRAEQKVYFVLRQLLAAALIHKISRKTRKVPWSACRSAPQHLTYIFTGNYISTHRIKCPHAVKVLFYLQWCNYISTLIDHCYMYTSADASTVMSCGTPVSTCCHDISIQ